MRETEGEEGEEEGKEEGLGRGGKETFCMEAVHSFVGGWVEVFFLSFLFLSSFHFSLIHLPTPRALRPFPPSLVIFAVCP